MLKRLRRLLVGKSVLISHIGSGLRSYRGICVAVHKTPSTKNHFDVELKKGSRYGVVAENVTDNSVEGELAALAGGRRKVQVVDG
mgnify:CR=1 FL=1